MRHFSRVCAAIALSAFALSALDTTNLKPQGYVSDFAHVIDAGARTQMEQYCYAVEQATGAEIALVTVDTLDGEPIEDVANRLARQWGVGKRGKDEGLLLLFAIRDHKDRGEVGYGLEPIAPDGYVGGVLRGIRPILRQGDYGSAFAEALQQIGNHIAEGKGVAISPLQRRPARQRPGLSIPWPVGLIGLLFLLWLVGRGGGGGFLTGLFLGNLMGRGGGGWGGGSGWGGGGFGGSDSGGGGGGFGGFGGGDFGGGGASSDW